MKKKKYTPPKFDSDLRLAVELADGTQVHVRRSEAHGGLVYYTSEVDGGIVWDTGIASLRVLLAAASHYAGACL